MAGGGGTRLWPASIPERPKQLLDPLMSDDHVPHANNLLSRTIERLGTLVGPGDSWIVTAALQREGVRLAVEGKVALEQIIAEPYGRNTAAAIALSAAQIRAHVGEHDDPTLVVLPADHHVTKTAQFQALLHTACTHAEQTDAIVTLGITPDRPATGFGYIEREADPCDAVPDDGANPVFSAVRFVEKPDHDRAVAFLESGRFLWNAGIFVMKLSRIEQELDRHTTIWAGLAPVREALRGGDAATIDQAIASAYEGLESLPIDIAVMEKVSGLRVVPADIGWTDLGSWEAVYDLANKDAIGNAQIHGGPAPLFVDANRCLTWSEDAVIAVIGLDDVTVVHADNRILVMPRSRSQDVKKVVTALIERERAEER